VPAGHDEIVFFPAAASSAALRGSVSGGGEPGDGLEGAAGAAFHRGAAAEKGRRRVCCGFALRAEARRRHVRQIMAGELDTVVVR